LGKKRKKCELCDAIEAVKEQMDVMDKNVHIEKGKLQSQLLKHFGNGPQWKAKDGDGSKERERAAQSTWSHLASLKCLHSNQNTDDDELKLHPVIHSLRERS